jgi:hypothetical protein
VRLRVLYFNVFAVCEELKSQLTKVTAELETCQAELQSRRAESDEAAQRSSLRISDLENTVHRLTDEQAALHERVRQHVFVECGSSHVVNCHADFWTFHAGRTAFAGADGGSSSRENLRALC